MEATPPIKLFYNSKMCGEPLKRGKPGNQQKRPQIMQRRRFNINLGSEKVSILFSVDFKIVNCTIMRYFNEFIARIHKLIRLRFDAPNE